MDSSYIQPAMNYTQHRRHHHHHQAKKQVGGIQKRIVVTTVPPRRKAVDEPAPRTKKKAACVRPNVYSAPASDRSTSKTKRDNNNNVFIHSMNDAEALFGTNEKECCRRDKKSSSLADAIHDTEFVSHHHDGTAEEDHRSTRFLPILDIDNEANQEQFLKDYSVQRLPVIMVHSMDEIAQQFVQHVIQKCKQKYKKSSWLIVWRNNHNESQHGVDDISILAEQHRDYGEYSNLRTMLETGKLYGCDLRGNPKTGRFGLVANKTLPARTVVAVECGVLYSEREHDRFVRESGDIMKGLKSNYIDPSLLEPLASSKVWADYRRCKYNGRVPGLVMDSNTCGNETRFIGDWNFASDDMDGPNLESFAVIDLKHSVITVAFETACTVEPGEELWLDLGCWNQLSQTILPGQAQMSQLLERRYRALLDIIERFNIPIDVDATVNRVVAQKRIKPINFSAKSGIYEAIDDYGKDCQYGIIFDLLGKLREDGPDALESVDDATVSNWSVPAPADIVNPQYEGLFFAVRSTDETTLSPDTARELDKVPVHAGTNFYKLRHELVERCCHDIEIVEIADPKHPAKLFSLPGDRAYGVQAKRDILKGSNVLAYGGTIEENPGNSENLYIYDISEFMPDEYKGPDLFINGSSSIGGRLNDAWRPSGDTEENLIPIQHWDETTNTPQMLFQASRDIKKGEELVYNYGDDYWKVMFQRLVQEHARFAGERNEHCKLLRRAILRCKDWDVNHLRDMERSMLSTPASSR